MNRKYLLAGGLVVVGILAFQGCSGLRHIKNAPSGVRDGTALTQSVAGFKVRLVAVVDAPLAAQQRRADHAWWSSGASYEGAEARLWPRTMANAPAGGLRREIVFELEQPQAIKKRETDNRRAVASASPIDVFAYLPEKGQPDGDSAENPGAVGPTTIRIWHGVPNAFNGHLMSVPPASVVLEFGVQRTDPQPVVFGVAQGAFKILAKGSASITKLNVGKAAVLATGPWGRIEATHLQPPQAETAPSPTHRFRLLGGVFPPKNERKVLFFDSKGKVIATCGDGANNPGYAGAIYLNPNGPETIVRFEIEERPYEFGQFDGVSFDSPAIDVYTGEQGVDHAVDSSIGQVVGVLRVTKDGSWSGSVLYAADGTRWTDPLPYLAAYEYGMFDGGTYPFESRLNILFEPGDGQSPSKTPITCEVYALDSPDGPKKERLTLRKAVPFQSPMTAIECRTTARPYVRLEIEEGGAGKAPVTMTLNSPRQSDPR